MASKNDMASNPAKLAVEQFSRRVMGLGEIRYKKMFGGYGVFEGGTMFALVNPEGNVYLKVVESNRTRFEAMGMVKHDRMPYYQIPEQIMADDARILEWTREAIAGSKFSKK